MCQSALKFSAKGIEASPFPLGHAAASSRRVWRAIINSSFVRTTQAETLLSRELIRGPPASFAAASNSSPSHPAVAQARRRIKALFSPMPAVKTSASIPPSAAASEPSSRPIR